MVIVAICAQIGTHIGHVHDYDPVFRIPATDFSVRYYLLYALVAFGGANIFNFVLNRHWTFRSVNRAHQQEGQVFLHERCAVDRAERPVPVQDEVEDVRAPEGDERVQQVVADAEVGGRDPEHRVVVVHMADVGADLGADRDDHHVDGDAGATVGPCDSSCSSDSS